MIGSGIIGLMTALELIKKGRKVTVYSSSIPGAETEGTKEIASQILPVIWMPKEHDWSEDLLQHELLTKMSYDQFKESVGLARYQSVKEVTVWDVANDGDDLKEVVSSYVCDMVKPQKINF